MTLREFYSAIGGDYEGAKSRFSTDERIKKFALKFENDGSYNDLCKALSAGNVKEAFRAAHTLKGVCLNLGFDSLYRSASAVTEILRAGSLDTGSWMDELRTNYIVLISAINSLKYQS